jgi:hypothetical protein
LLKRFLAILGIVSISNCLWVEKPAYARPAFPISEISFSERTDLGDGDVYLNAKLTVPDQNTTRSVVGNLRRYDLHIAKMFEVTDYQCRNWQNSPIPYEGEKGIAWVYSAGGGDKWIGIFTIDCDKARNVMNSFAPGKLENTKISYYKAKHSKNVPSLALTTSQKEIARWVEFVKSVPPQQSP